MKKLFILTLLIFSMLMVKNKPVEAACNCYNVKTIMDITRESVNANALEVVNQLMQQPDLSSVTSCLTAVRGGLSGFFTLSLPSIDSLLSGVCDAVMQAVWNAAMGYLQGSVQGISTWASFFDIKWNGQIGGSPPADGNSLFTIDGDIVNFSVTQHNVDLSGSIQNLFN